jgi:hypothetical protein
VAIETIPTLYLTGVRFTAAGVILLVIAALRGQPMPRRASQWGHEAVTGILLFSMANGAVVWAVFELWNGLMPSIFGLHTITYWQALGLMALSWILFRGFRGPQFDRDPWARGMRERWRKMTPADREEFTNTSDRWGELEPRVGKVTVEGECSFQLMTAHQDKGDAVREADPLVGELREQVHGLSLVLRV